MIPELGRTPRRRRLRCANGHVGGLANCFFHLAFHPFSRACDLVLVPPGASTVRRRSGREAAELVPRPARGGLAPRRAERPAIERSFRRCTSLAGWYDARVLELLKTLGPGLVTGASDDDPSGIATYAVAGAAFGYSTLWTAVLTLPLMAAIQLVCARIGLVSGVGLTGALRRHYPRPILYAVCVLLLVANVFNIGADLGGMADAITMLSGVPRVLPIVAFGAAIILFTVY